MLCLKVSVASAILCKVSFSSLVSSGLCCAARWAFSCKDVKKRHLSLIIFLSGYGPSLQGMPICSWGFSELRSKWSCWSVV